MRVNVTEGYTKLLRLKVIDDLDLDLSTATFKIGLVQPDTPAADPAWRTPSRLDFPRAGLAVVEMVIDASHDLGTFYPGVTVDDGDGPERLLVMRETVTLL